MAKRGLIILTILVCLFLTFRYSENFLNKPFIWEYNYPKKEKASFLTYNDDTIVLTTSNKNNSFLHLIDKYSGKKVGVIKLKKILSLLK